MRYFRHIVLGLALCSAAPVMARAPETSLRPIPRLGASVAVVGPLRTAALPQGGVTVSPVPPARPGSRVMRGAGEGLPQTMVPAMPQAAPARVTRPRPRPTSDTALAGIAGAPRTAVPVVPAPTAQAPATSPSPEARSTATLDRFTRSAAREGARAGGGGTLLGRIFGGGQSTTPAAAGRTGGGGLCGSRGIEGRSLPRVTSNVQGCGIADPVSVTAVGGIRLSQAATLDCDTARALERWVRDGLQPAMGRTGGGVTQINIAAHYSCRTRNNRPGARISEHGRGRAIDISGFRLANGETVTVLRDWPRGSHSRALRQMHRAACGPFGTVLGPAADRFHQDHFHFDTAQHRGGPYCR